MKGFQMKKKSADESVVYAIEWSKPFQYDRFSASRVLPDMPGILFFSEKRGDDHYSLLLFATWREGLRGGMRNLMDETISAMPKTAVTLKEKKLYYRYAIVDSSPYDLKDILFWLIRTYEPEFNSVRDFVHSNRYEKIAVNERRVRG